MLGRDDLTREDSDDGITYSDLKSMEEIDSALYPKKFTYHDFLPNSLLKRKQMRRLRSSITSVMTGKRSASTCMTEGN